MTIPNAKGKLKKQNLKVPVWFDPIAGLVVVLTLASMTSCSDSAGVEPPKVSAASSADPSMASASDGRQEGFLRRVRSVKGHLMLDKEGRVVDLAIPSQMKLRKGDVALIGRMSELWRLNFVDESAIADGDLKELKRLGKLQWLILNKSHVTDAGMIHLASMKQLERLHLGEVDLSDSGLNRLGGLTNLVELNVRGTKVTNAGLAYLRNMSRLANIDLSETRITGAGLSHIAGLTRLTDLNLTGTKVNDAGLRNLEKLEKLRVLYVGSTNVTDAGVAKLKSKLPKLMFGR